jgi:C4-dicarboxylate-specific signal transduction histidine kinase
VGEVLELAHSDLVHRGVVVDTRLSATPPLVYADRVQLQQVLLNLIMNACDAMGDTPPGDRVLTIATATADGVARIEVCDRGSGIAPGALQSVFEPFVTTKRGGLGLGLAICRSIVTAHGGETWARNNRDRGATLVVSLPLAAPLASPLASPLAAT